MNSYHAKHCGCHGACLVKGVGAPTWANHPRARCTSHTSPLHQTHFAYTRGRTVRKFSVRTQGHKRCRGPGEAAITLRPWPHAQTWRAAREWTRPEQRGRRRRRRCPRQWRCYQCARVRARAHDRWRGTLEGQPPAPTQGGGGRGEGGEGRKRGAGVLGGGGGGGGDATPGIAKGCAPNQEVRVEHRQGSGGQGQAQPRGRTGTAHTTGTRTSALLSSNNACTTLPPCRNSRTQHMRRQRTTARQQAHDPQRHTHIQTHTNIRTATPAGTRLGGSQFRLHFPHVLLQAPEVVQALGQRGGGRRGVRRRSCRRRLQRCYSLRNAPEWYRSTNDSALAPTRPAHAASTGAFPRWRASRHRHEGHPQARTEAARRG